MYFSGSLLYFSLYCLAICFPILDATVKSTTLLNSSFKIVTISLEYSFDLSVNVSLVNSTATTGRHYNVSLMMLCHTATNGAMSKILLNECHAIVLFPGNMTGKSSKYLLDNYFGLEKIKLKILKM